MDIEDHYIHGQPKHTASINATLIDSDPKVLASMEWFVGEVMQRSGPSARIMHTVVLNVVYRSGFSEPVQVRLADAANRAYGHLGY